MLINPPRAPSFLPHMPPLSTLSMPTAHAVGCSQPGSSNIFVLSTFITRRHSLTIVLAAAASNLTIAVTNLYGLSDHHDTHLFLDGLLELAPHIIGPWLLASDFNLVHSTAEKSNGRVDRQLCEAFNDAIEALEIVELPLLDKLFTWSNNRASPTLERLDRMFVNNLQCSTFPTTVTPGFRKANQVHTYMHARIKFHACSRHK
jgi:hypothetical protein